MSIHINGQVFYSANEVIENLSISRQTLWRWRSEGKIPPGNRYRGKRILFTSDELNEIRDHAHHIEPIETTNANQLLLFDKVVSD